MLSFKFSVLVLSLAISWSAVSKVGFSQSECLNSNFETKVSHRGQPFGLLENVLTLSKEKCIITINHERLKFLKNEWHVDVCRGPVHVKTGAGAVKVLRREGDCHQELMKSDYCQEIASLRRILEDDGLIFAEGEKERLQDAHGQVTCAVQLLDEYLHEGRILSRHGKTIEPQKSQPFQENTYVPSEPLPPLEEDGDSDLIDELDEFESDLEVTF